MGLQVTRVDISEQLMQPSKVLIQPRDPPQRPYNNRPDRTIGFITLDYKIATRRFPAGR